MAVLSKENRISANNIPASLTYIRNIAVINSADFANGPGGTHLQYWRTIVGYGSAASRYPVYHILLAAYVPLWLVSNNSGLFDASDAIRPIVLSTGLALAAFASLRFLLHDKHKAAFVAAVFTACFYSFSFLRETLPLTSAGSGALAVMATVCLGALLFAFKTQALWPAASRILNGFMAAMLVIPLLTIANLNFGSLVQGKAAAFEPRGVQAARTPRPNIIHIVVDAYSRADVLKKVYGLDNSKFIRALRNMGFVVPNRATTAYSQTLLSMNSIFSLHYINDHLHALAKNNGNKKLRFFLNQGLQDSPVVRALRSLSYRLISVESLYKGVQLEDVDHLITESPDGFEISYFEKVLMRFTPIQRIIERLAVEDTTYAQVHFALGKIDLGQFKPPFFVYNHIIAPHPPFNIAADGSPRPTSFDLGDGSNRLEVDPDWYDRYRRGYVEKVRYVNTALLKKVRYLMTNVPDPKIIVIHSDHGGGLLLDTDSKSRTCLKERMSAFLAVYSSNQDLADDFPDRTNLVNLYRIILRTTFGADLPSLPPHSYFAAWKEPYNLEEVTDADLDTFGPTCSTQSDAITQQ